MPTYRTTANLQLRTPSGAVGEAPDGPGGMATLADDIDLMLGVGGAERAANLAAITAIPTARTFFGKLAYAADTSYTYRYCGTTDGWVLWDMGRVWQPFTYASGFSNSASNSISLRWTIRSGILIVQGIVFGTFVNGTSTTVTTTANVPPAQYRPNPAMVSLTFPAASQLERPAFASLGPDGILSVAWNNLGTAATAPAWISIDASFPYGQNI